MNYWRLTWRNDYGYHKTEIFENYHEALNWYNFYDSLGYYVIDYPEPVTAFDLIRDTK